MIPRYSQPLIEHALDREAAVALIGPRQVGKTTLALAIAEQRPSIYLDLESRTGGIRGQFTYLGVSIEIHLCAGDSVDARDDGPAVPLMSNSGRSKRSIEAR